MKILVVTNLYPPHALGGYELSCRDTVDRWIEAGHEVDVLTTTTTFHDRADDPPEPHVHRSLDWYWVDHRLIRPQPRHRLRMERHNQQTLRERLDAAGPDVVSLWAMGGMSMGLIATCVDRGLPIVAVIEDDWLVYAPKIDPWTAGWQKRPKVLAGVANQVTSLPTTIPSLGERSVVAFASHYLRDKALAEASVQFSDHRVVPLGIDSTDFPPRRPGSRPWAWRLLVVGRVEPRKGFDTAVRALVGLPGATLQIVGGGDDRHRDDLLALAADLGVADRVELSGGVERSRIAEVYAAADVVLFPSRWDEPFGLVPLEAMSQATPVIATRRGGSAEFLTDGLNCLEVPVDDPEAMVEAVQSLADDQSLRRRLVNGGLTTISSYRVDRFADQLEVLHQEIAGRPPESMDQ
jgi:glycosyltransferase involved in cell wall biosynthesis